MNGGYRHQSDQHSPMTAQKRNEAAMVDNAYLQVSRTKDPVEKIRLRCLQKGTSGILDFGRFFRRVDGYRSGNITMDELHKGAADDGLHLTDDEAQALFAVFERDHSGHINYNEFLKAVRPPMDNARMNTVNMAFNKLDKTGDGQVTLEDMSKMYSVKAHPEYMNGDRTKNEIIEELLKHFRIHGTAGGFVTRDEFLDYYSGVSASMEEDGYFDLVLRKCWKL